MNTILDKLVLIYGEKQGKETYKKLKELVKEEHKFIHSHHARWKIPVIFPLQRHAINEKFRLHKLRRKQYFSEKDIVLITFANAFQQEKQLPLQTLHAFLDDTLKGLIDTVHILPFHPFTADRGFAVADFYKVKKEFGDWKDIESIAKDYRLMADLVLNHVSSAHEWFQKFLAGEEKYQNYFISFEEKEIPREDLKKLFRPRATECLTPFETKKGKRYVWTTFSKDQIDLNYQNPEVFLEMVKTILFLLRKGVRVVRMDAITFIWKELGTNSIHRPNAYRLLELFRTIFDLVYPSALLITETNVPHKENISYFRDGIHGAHMVYNFALPPLVLHAFKNQDALHLTTWANTLTVPSKDTTFFNFLSSHDGIGVLGARGILPDKEIATLSKSIIKNGGKISYRTMPDGSKSIYEMNSTWWSALHSPEESFSITLQKFITSIAISFAIAGVPAIYYGSLFGEENDLDTWKKTNFNRDINERKLNYPKLTQQLENVSSKQSRVLSAVKSLIASRINNNLLHPNASQQILDLDKRIFAVLRQSQSKRLLALHNVSGSRVKVHYEDTMYELAPYAYLWKEI